MLHKKLSKYFLALFALPMAVGAAVKYWNPLDTATVPKTLSATGFYTNINAKKKVLDTSAHHFDVASPLWSDGAHKNRWVILPNGKPIGFNPKGDYYEYPDSTIFIKLFELDTVLNDATTRKPWELRVLYLKKMVVDSAKTPYVYYDKWFSYSYKWNADGKNGILVNPNSGLNDTIKIYTDNSKTTFKYKKWVFPRVSGCVRCHVASQVANNPPPALPFDQGRTVLGFFTAQLNRPHPDSSAVNQLEVFFSKRILKGTKPRNWKDTSEVPHWAGVSDTSESVDLRARSYLAANCSGCHGTKGLALIAADYCPTINMDFHTGKPAMEFRHIIYQGYSMRDSLPVFYPKTDLGNNPKGKDSIEILPALIVPGYPQKSELLYRQLKRNEEQPTSVSSWEAHPEQMPPLGVFEVHTEAVELLRKWILNMPKLPAPNPILKGIHSPHFSATPIFDGHFLRLPPELLRNPQDVVSLSEINGQKIPMKKLNSGVYALPNDLHTGLYIIRIGNRVFTKYRL